MKTSFRRSTFPAAMQVAPAGAPGSMTAVGPAHTGPSWGTVGGAVKMVAKILTGVGVIVIALGVGSFSSAYSSSTGPSLSTFTNLLNSIEAGLLVAGVAVMLYGSGELIASLHRA